MCWFGIILYVSTSCRFHNLCYRLCCNVRSLFSSRRFYPKYIRTQSGNSKIETIFWRSQHNLLILLSSYTILSSYIFGLLANGFRPRLWRTWWSSWIRHIAEVTSTICACTFMGFNTLSSLHRGAPGPCYSEDDLRYSWTGVFLPCRRLLREMWARSLLHRWKWGMKKFLFVSVQNNLKNKNSITNNRHSHSSSIN